MSPPGSVTFLERVHRHLSVVFALRSFPRGQAFESEDGKDEPDLSSFFLPPQEEGLAYVRCFFEQARATLRLHSDLRTFHLTALMDRPRRHTASSTEHTLRTLLGDSIKASIRCATAPTIVRSFSWSWRSGVSISLPQLVMSGLPLDLTMSLRLCFRCLWTPSWNGSDPQAMTPLA